MNPDEIQLRFIAISVGCWCTKRSNVLCCRLSKLDVSSSILQLADGVLMAALSELLTGDEIAGTRCMNGLRLINMIIIHTHNGTSNAHVTYNAA